MPVLVFVLLLEGKANLKGCGTLTLPSDESIESAPADVKARFFALKSIAVVEGTRLRGRLEG